MCDVWCSELTIRKPTGCKPWFPDSLQPEGEIPDFGLVEEWIGPDEFAAICELTSLEPLEIAGSGKDYPVCWACLPVPVMTLLLFQSKNKEFSQQVSGVYAPKELCWV
jgi:hypothetical protein